MAENAEKAVEKTQKKKKKEKRWVDGLKAEFKKIIWRIKRQSENRQLQL